MADKTRSQIGKASREKGKRYEREVATKFRAAGIDPEARRGQQYCGHVVGNPDVVTNTPLHIECKYVDKLNLSAAMAQSIHDALVESETTGRNKIPCVIHRRARTESLITMRLADFLPILKKYLDMEEGMDIEKNEF